MSSLNNQMMNLNVSDSAEEAALDKQLKDAGLLEEGMTHAEKKQLLNLIKESENSAKEEEEKRRQQHVTTGKKKAISPNMEISEVPSVPQTPVSEDSDPIITFESPSTISRRKALRSHHTNPKMSPKTKSSSNKEDGEDRGSPSGTYDLSSIKKSHTVFTNSSVTIKYVKSPSNFSQDIIVSETDEESDGSEETSTHGVKSSNSTDITEEEKSRSSSAKTSSAEIASENSTHSGTTGTATTSDGSKKSESILGSDLYKSSVNMSTTAKPAASTSTQSENLIKKPKVDSKVKDHEDLASGPDTISRKGAKSNDSEAADSTSSLTQNNNSTSQAVEDPLFSTKISDSLLKRVSLLNEKSSQAYFKVPHETDTKCVKRIYSLITEWQSKLSQYQRKLLKHSRWGPPITIDRQIKNGLLKKASLNYRSKATTSTAYVDMSSSSSASETFLSDESDDNFEPFQKKDKKLRKKNVLSLRKTDDSSDKQGKTNCDENKITNEANQETPETESDLFVSSDVQNNDGMEFPLDDEAEIESQSLLPDLPTVSLESAEGETSAPSVATATNIKCFRLCSLKEDGPEESNTEQNSPEIFSSQPNLSTGNDTDSQRNNENISIGESPDDESCGSLLSRIQANTLSRNRTKRKLSPNPFSTPPPKKVATTSNADNPPEDVIIRPASVRLKNPFRSSRRKDIESESSPDKESQEAAVVKVIKVNEVSLEACQRALESNEDKDERTRSSSRLTHNVAEDKQESPSANPEEVCGVENPHSSKVTSVSEESVECPLCQVMFSFSKIQGHASECNGPPESVVTRKKKLFASSRSKEADIYYLETLKPSAHPSKR